MACLAQNQYKMLLDIKPTILADSSEHILVNYGCGDCDHPRHSIDTVINLRHNQQWVSQFDALKTKGWHYDTTGEYYILSDSFLHTIRSIHYSIFINNPYKSLGLGANQNAHSLEYIFNTGDSAIGTIRYRVVCPDCPYPKRRKLYYIFYYDKNGLVVRHGLAYLRKGAKR